MSLLALAEVYGAYAVLAFILAFAVLVAWINTTGTVPPMLDGTPFMSMLDDRDRGYLIDIATAAERREERAVDAFAFQLEEIRNLPAREHPPVA